MAFYLSFFLLAFVLAVSQVIARMKQKNKSLVLYCNMYPIQGSQLRFHLLLGTCSKDGGEFSRRDFQCDKWMSIKEPRSSQVFWQLTPLLFWSFQFTLIFPISRPHLFDISNFSSPRWHEFCTVLWGDTTVCSNRGLGVKRHLVPKYKYGFSCLN